MSLNSAIISDMEGIVDDAFFSETIEHDYPTDESEDLTIVWSEPESNGINEQYDSSLPSFLMKTSDKTNIDRENSRFIRDSKTYQIESIFDDTSGLTKIEVSEVDS